VTPQFSHLQNGHMGIFLPAACELVSTKGLSPLPGIQQALSECLFHGSVNPASPQLVPSPTAGAQGWEGPQLIVSHRKITPILGRSENLRQDVGSREVSWQQSKC
jgi:hypothetical protein